MTAGADPKLGGGNDDSAGASKACAVQGSTAGEVTDPTSLSVRSAAVPLGPPNSTKDATERDAQLASAAQPAGMHAPMHAENCAAPKMPNAEMPGPSSSVPIKAEGDESLNRQGGHGNAAAPPIHAQGNHTAKLLDTHGHQSEDTHDDKRAVNKALIAPKHDGTNNGAAARTAKPQPSLAESLVTLNARRPSLVVCQEYQGDGGRQEYQGDGGRRHLLPVASQHGSSVMAPSAWRLLKAVGCDGHKVNRAMVQHIQVSRPPGLVTDLCFLQVDQH